MEGSYAAIAAIVVIIVIIAGGVAVIKSRSTGPSPATYGVSVSISPKSQSGDNGTTLAYIVDVHNTGNVSDNYTLTVSDNASPSWGPHFSATSLPNVSAGGYGRATLNVLIPSNAAGGAIDSITVEAIGTGINGSAICMAQISSGSIVTYKTYTNENYSIKFDYLENWDFSSQDFGLTPPLVAYFDAAKNTGLTGEILLYVFDKAGYENQFAMNLDNLTSYVASLENQFENNENFVVRSPPTVVAIDNHNGVRLMVTAVQSTSDNVRFQLETVVKDNYFYAFEIAAPEENYSSTYKPIFERVIGSFSLLG